MIFFLSDNGGASGQGVALTNYASNNPLRGRKATFWEGALRVPFIMNWPGTIEGGTVDSAVVSSLDIVPTVLALAGLKPESHLPLDGELLINKNGELAKTTGRSLFWRYHNHFAIRQGDWKLILLHEQDPWLVNLEKDLTETHNRASEQPDRIQALTRAISEWNQCLKPPGWTRQFMEANGLIRRIPLPIYEPNSGVSYQPER